MDIRWPWKQLPIVSGGIKSGFYFSLLSLLPALQHPPSFPRIPRQLSELLPFRRLLQDGADSQWCPHPWRFSCLYFPSAQWLPHVDGQHWLCRWECFTYSQSAQIMIKTSLNDFMKILNKLHFSFLIQASAWPRSCKEMQVASSLQAQRRAFSSRWAALTAAWVTCPPSTQRHRATLEQDTLHHTSFTTLQFFLHFSGYANNYVHPGCKDIPLKTSLTKNVIFYPMYYTNKRKTQ